MARQLLSFNLLSLYDTVDKTLPSQDLSETWASIASVMRTEVTPDTFDRWFKEIELVELTAQHLTLHAPNKIHQFWIESNYINLLQSAIMLILGSARAVKFALSEESPAAASAAVRPIPIEEEKEEKEIGGRSSGASATHGMNPRNTFEAFVVGPTNQFAQAACKAVADSPAKTYNPLFIYGGVGLGKTHLMQAIGQHINGRKKGAKVVYITSESFTNDFIEAIQNNGLIKFRKRYRQADILLIDDIQFLADKGRTQEEFFHTFNALFDGHKQIVLSSDRPPSEISNLETRLVSRFEWGLTAELQVPDTETRVAILRKKAERMEIKVPMEVLQFLAERIRTNVRRLEGALMRVASYTSLNEGRSPNIEKVEQLLKDILHEEARRSITIDQIQRRVAEHFDVRLADMTSKRRPQNIAFPRQIAMYLARELTKTSLSEIGDAFGGRDHGTVLHAHRLVKEKILKDDKTRHAVSLLDSQLSR
jgi:chromosomal replication initiator protein